MYKVELDFKNAVLDVKMCTFMVPDMNNIYFNYKL